MSLRYGQAEFELQFASRYGRHRAFAPRPRPMTMEYKVQILKDSINAAVSMSKEETKARWRALYDKCLNLAGCWAGVLCILLYRESVLNNDYSVHPAGTARPSDAPASVSALQGGTLAVARILLQTTPVHSFAFAYIAALHVFRIRSGQRTIGWEVNDVEPGRNPEPGPECKGFAALAARHAAGRARGKWVCEINDTIRDVAAGGRFELPRASTISAPGAAARHPGPSPPVPPVEPTVLPGPWNPAGCPSDSVCPGDILLEHMARRVRSRLPALFGVAAFAVVLGTEGGEEERLEYLLGRARRLHRACSDGHVPDYAQLDIERLLRNDISQSILEICAGAPLVCRHRQTIPPRPDGDIRAAGQRKTVGRKRRRVNSGSPPKLLGPPVQWAGKSAAATQPNAAEAPRYTVAEISNCLAPIARSCFGVLHGTRFLVENAFGSIRRFQKPGGHLKRGANPSAPNMATLQLAQNASSAKYAAVARRTPILP